MPGIRRAPSSASSLLKRRTASGIQNVIFENSVENYDERPLTITKLAITLLHDDYNIDEHVVEKYHDYNDILNTNLLSHLSPPASCTLTPDDLAD